MAIQLKNIVSDIYLKLGNIGTSALPLSVVLVHLYDSLDRHLLEMKISNQNWLLRQYEIQIQQDTYDYAFAATSFGDPVTAEMTTDGIRWIEVPIINFMMTHEFSNQSTPAIAFYNDSLTQQTRVKTTFNTHTPLTLRVWYEPDEAAPKELAASPNLPTLFRGKISTEVAGMCLPFANIDPSKISILMRILSSQVENWNELWETEMFRVRGLGRGRRGPPFRAGT